MRLALPILALLALGGCDEQKATSIADCRVEAAKALPAEAVKTSTPPYFSQPFNTFVKDCMTAKGFRFDEHHNGCPNRALTTELQDACYRWSWESASPAKNSN